MKSFDQQVADWARTKPADEAYRYGACQNCALAQFLLENGLAKEPNVGGEDWGELTGERHPLSGRIRSALVSWPWTFGALAERLSS